MLLLAAATPAAPLAPNGPWIVEAQENLCLLSRRYGTGDDVVTVGFQPLFNAPTMELIVVSPDRSSRQRVGKATVAVGSAEDRIASYFSLVLPGKGLRVSRITVDSRVWEEVRTAPSLAIDAPPVRVTVGLAAAEKARRVFDQCQDSLLKSWGVDPAVLKTQAAVQAVGNPGKFFGPDLYPAEAIRAGNFGRVVTVLRIGADGAVADCRVVVRAGKALDDQTCKIAEKVRFAPAKDAAGHPVDSIYILPVRWVLP